MPRNLTTNRVHALRSGDALCGGRIHLRRLCLLRRWRSASLWMLVLRRIVLLHHAQSPSLLIKKILQVRVVVIGRATRCLCWRKLPIYSSIQRGLQCLSMRR